MRIVQFIVQKRALVLVEYKGNHGVDNVKVTGGVSQSRALYNTPMVATCPRMWYMAAGAAGNRTDRSCTVRTALPAFITQIVKRP